MRFFEFLDVQAALRRRFHPEIPATEIGRLYALLDTSDDTAGLELREPIRAALFAGFCASRSDVQQAEVFAFLRDLIEGKVRELASGSLARQSGEALLMRLRLFEGGAPQIEVMDRLLGSRLGPAFRVGLGQDARLLRDAQRLSAEQAETLQRRGLLPKVHVPPAERLRPVRHGGQHVGVVLGLVWQRLVQDFRGQWYGYAGARQRREPCGPRWRPEESEARQPHGVLEKVKDLFGKRRK